MSSWSPLKCLSGLLPDFLLQRSHWLTLGPPWPRLSPNHPSGLLGCSLVFLCLPYQPQLPTPSPLFPPLRAAELGGRVSGELTEIHALTLKQASQLRSDTHIHLFTSLNEFLLAPLLNLFLLTHPLMSLFILFLLYWSQAWLPGHTHLSGNKISFPALFSPLLLENEMWCSGVKPSASTLLPSSCPRPFSAEFTPLSFSL